MKRALITGITGQDGSYLAELLLSQGYEVHGFMRRTSLLSTHRLQNIFEEQTDNAARLKLHYGDVTDPVRITNIIATIKPDEIYHLASQSHVKVSFDEPLSTTSSVAMSTISILSAMRDHCPEARYYQASSSEMFGDTPPPQSEVSIMRPRSPYAVAKNAAYWSVINARDSYGMFAVNGILFNHESPRRGVTFVTRKISLAAAKIKLGLQEKLYLGNLEAYRDWGYAPEYVEAMYLIMQNEAPKDYVVATGVTATVTDFLQAAFSVLDLNPQDYVETDSRYLRPNEVPALCGDPKLIAVDLGWRATTTWGKLAEIMVEADVSTLKEQLKGNVSKFTVI